MSCETCGCIKGGSTSHLGRGCTKCEGNKCGKTSGGCTCQCKPGGNACNPGECKCDNKCECTIGTYRSAYRGLFSFDSTLTGETITVNREATWKDLNTITSSRSKCAQTLLGSVCLIWSGLTYMYWTGKYHKSSPRWNNHILDGTGLDDGTLSQWLQALGFPRDMLNNSGPGNRLDAVITNEFREKLYVGFPDTGNGGTAHGSDHDDNTFRNPAGMNFAGYIHTLDRGAFDSDVFKDNGNGVDKNKLGALFKLYILSCAYFTGLQKKAPPKAENRTPKTIREILYWLSALPYSQAYPEILEHGKGRLEEVLRKPGESDSASGNEQKQLKFHQTDRPAPITVDEFNLFAHFQAVTQYCPLVLIGIQGGIHSTDSTPSHKEPPIHSLYANTECSFTYPTVSIQAYNQVVHYIRGLFYQLYFLRKQCAVKVTSGGKWRECRYGNGVVSKGVISWMCLGCNPMEHDRKSRVGRVNGEIVKGIKKDSLAEKLKDVLLNIGDVVVQLGNAQEALERRNGIDGVRAALTAANKKLVEAREELYESVKKGGLTGQELTQAKKELDELSKKDGNGKLKDVVGKLNSGDVTDPAKNNISGAIKGVRDALEALKNELKDYNSLLKGGLADWVTEKFQQAIDQIKNICNSPKCSACQDHSTKCGQPSKPMTCPTCLQPTTTGVPSPLQAFLEDRLPGFSCEVVREIENTNNYPPAVLPYLMPHLGGCPSILKPPPG